MGKVTFKPDRAGIKAVLNSPEAVELVGARARSIADAAEAAGAGFHTKQWKKDGRWVGGRIPKFDADARKGRRGAVGLVWPRNYAAALFNSKTNILLKSKGGGP